MKLRLDRREFADAARLASRQIPSRPLATALGGLLLEADAGQLTISAFDFETATRTTIPADVAEPGRVLIAGRLLADIAASLTGDDIDLTTEDTEAVLTCGHTQFAINLMPVEDYPALPAMPAVTGVVPAELLAAAVKGAAAAVDPTATGTLAAMAGIRVHAEAGELVVTASDRYRVPQYRLPWSGADAEAVTFPAKALLDAVRSATAADIGLALPLSGTAGVDCGGRTVTIRLIDASFPDVERIFPSEFGITATLDAGELAAAARRIALVAEEKTPLLCEFADGQLILRSSTQASAARGTDRIPAELSGADRLRIAFKPEYLLDGLAPLDGEIHLDLVQPLKPGLLRSTTDDSYQYLIMPVRHAWVTGTPVRPAA